MRSLRQSRILLLPLFLFDLVLGSITLVAPGLYITLVHPLSPSLHPDGPTYWLTRTAVLWLFFSAVEGTAALRPTAWPALVALAGVLRLMDVPADLAYYVAADDLGRFGTFCLVFSPLFNLAAGAYLTLVGMRGIPARRKIPPTDASPDCNLSGQKAGRSPEARRPIG